MPNRPGSATTQLDGHALDGHTERPPRLPLHDRDDLRQRLESLQHRFRCVGRDDHRQALRRVPPAAWIARGLASQLLGDRLHERSAPVELERPDGRGARLALERGLQLALGLRPDPGHLS